nr:MAG TPA_asm: hypothetical protein [Bacteriophage sp.]
MINENTGSAIKLGTIPFFVELASSVDTFCFY